MDEEFILAVDPGPQKCGIAVLSRLAVRERRVVTTPDLLAAVGSWLARYPIRRVVVGNRTGSAEIRHRLMQRFPGLPLTLVDERGTTLEARRLYFEDHPPRGWRRLLPRSMQLPPEPYDDYAAVAVGRRGLALGRPGKPDGTSVEEEE